MTAISQNNKSHLNNIDKNISIVIRIINSIKADTNLSELTSTNINPLGGKTSAKNIN